MTNFNENEGVKIDVVHAYLILGLVLCHKPTKILELGLGGGRSCEAILSAMDFNKNSAQLTVVDNWCDWGGAMPAGVMEMYGNRASIKTSDEKEFVHSTGDKFDFIMSDADHNHTNEWFDYVYENLLLPGGIIIYHDINLFEDSFVNLRQIYARCLAKNYRHHLFNQNSLPGERCHRGLLVIFKDL